jgi:integration host factor subunit alpha
MTLSKPDIIDSIYNKTGLPKNKSTQLVDSVLEIITQTLANGEDILVILATSVPL